MQKRMFFLMLLCIGLVLSSWAADAPDKYRITVSTNPDGCMVAYCWYDLEGSSWQTVVTKTGNDSWDIKAHYKSNLQSTNSYHPTAENKALVALMKQKIRESEGGNLTKPARVH